MGWEDEYQSICPDQTPDQLFFVGLGLRTTKIPSIYPGLALQNKNLVDVMRSHSRNQEYPLILEKTCRSVLVSIAVSLLKARSTSLSVPCGDAFEKYVVHIDVRGVWCPCHFIPHDDDIAPLPRVAVDDGLALIRQRIVEHCTKGLHLPISLGATCEFLILSCMDFSTAVPAPKNPACQVRRTYSASGPTEKL